jgi:hypothetical protein
MRLPQRGLAVNNVNLVNLVNKVNAVTVRPPSGRVAVRYTRKHRQPSQTLSFARNFPRESLGNKSPVITRKFPMI